jgi:hypothetical protein
VLLGELVIFFSFLDLSSISPISFELSENNLIFLSYVVYEKIFSIPNFAIGEEYKFSTNDYLWGVILGTIVPILIEWYFSLKLESKNRKKEEP